MSDDIRGRTVRARSRCASWNCSRRAGRHKFCRECRWMLRGGPGYAVTEYGLLTPPPVTTSVTLDAIGDDDE